MSETEGKLSRRDLLARVSRGAAVGLGLTSGILPVYAEPRGKIRRVGANEKIVLGLIGCGGVGAEDMRQLMDKPEIEVAALCDVDRDRMPNDIKSVTSKYGKTPEIFEDYRKMLERKDID